MKISEIRIKLVSPSEEKLLAFASVTFDHCFVVRDIKIIQGGKGLFVAMPSRKITDRCRPCGAKNHLQANFCSHCGRKLARQAPEQDLRGRAKLHADIAHPINSRYRNELQEAILGAYWQELERSKRPGYVPASDMDLDEGTEAAEVTEDPHGVPNREGKPTTKGPDERNQSNLGNSNDPPSHPPGEPPTGNPEQKADAAGAPKETPPSPAPKKPTSKQRPKDGSGFGLFA